MEDQITVDRSQETTHRGALSEFGLTRVRVGSESRATRPAQSTALHKGIRLATAVLAIISIDRDR